MTVQPRESNGRWSSVERDEFAPDLGFEPEPFVEGSPVRYHVTLASNLDSIMRDVLVPSIGDRSSALGESGPAVFLFPSREYLEDATWLADEFDEEDELVVLEVDGVEGSDEFFELPVRGFLSPDRLRVSEVEF